MRSKANRRRTAWRVAALCVVAAAIVGGVAFLQRTAAARGFSLADLFTSVSALEEIVGAWGAWGPAASILTMVAHSFLPFPAELVAVANGMLFGFGPGVALTWIGAMLGAISAFALARTFGAGLVGALIGDSRRERMEAWTEAGGAGALITARLIPVISFNLVNFAAGLLRVGWWRFIWTTAIGILPVTVASVLAGSHMLEAPGWAWPLLAAGAASLWLGHRLLARRAAGASPDSANSPSHATSPNSAEPPDAVQAKPLRRPPPQASTGPRALNSMPRDGL